MSDRWGIIAKEGDTGLFKVALCSGRGEDCGRVTVHKLSKEEARETVAHWIREGSVLIKL